jgi:DNA-binding MarR family transcriptional regulator
VETDVQLNDRLDHLPFALRQASRAVDEVVVTLLREEGLTDLPLSAIHVLVLARVPRAVVTLAAGVRMSQQATGRAVRLLASRGFVTIEVDPMDRRQRIVATTGKGNALLRDLRDQLFVAVSLVTDAVGEDRLVDFADRVAELAMIEDRPTRW